jgi:Tfp pilus assembly protein PilF
MESAFGTQQRFDAAFKRAVQFNKAKRIYLQATQIHERNGHLDRAREMCQKAAEKFHDSKKVWIRYLTFLYSSVAPKPDDARLMLPKALSKFTFVFALKRAGCFIGLFAELG